MSHVADALVRAVSSSSKAEAGTVRVTCSEILGVEVLPEVIASLGRAYPRIQIELSPTNVNEDLLRRDADIAVRMAQPAQSALVAKRVATIELGLFASEAYLARRGVPRTLGELSRGHALIGRDRDANFYSFVAAAGIPVRRGGFALRTDSDAAQVSAIRAGVGIGVCQVPLAARPPRLVRVVPEVRFELPAWVVTHEDLRASRRVAVVFDHLAGALAAYAAAPRGRRKAARRT
jgi:DNA-binding transcriptional LysR family regulator